MQVDDFSPCDRHSLPFKLSSPRKRARLVSLRARLASWRAFLRSLRRSRASSGRGARLFVRCWRPAGVRRARAKRHKRGSVERRAPEAGAGANKAGDLSVECAATTLLPASVLLSLSFSLSSPSYSPLRTLLCSRFCSEIVSDRSTRSRLLLPAPRVSSPLPAPTLVTRLHRLFALSHPSLSLLPQSP